MVYVPSYIETSNIRHCKYLLRYLGKDLDSFLVSGGSFFTNYENDFIGRTYSIFLYSQHFFDEKSENSVFSKNPTLFASIIIENKKFSPVHLQDVDYNKEKLFAGHSFSTKQYYYTSYNNVLEVPIKYEILFLLDNDQETHSEYFQRIHKNINSPFYESTRNKLYIKQNEISTLIDFTKLSDKLKGYLP